MFIIIIIFLLFMLILLIYLKVNIHKYKFSIKHKEIITILCMSLFASLQNIYKEFFIKTTPIINSNKKLIVKH